MANPHVSQSKSAALQGRMARLGVREEDLKEKFVLGSGKGGQKLNKSSSCVYLRHLPSGIEVKCQQERGLALNRFLARRRLCDLIEEQRLGRESAVRQLQEKIRRQKRRRSRRQKQRMLEEKRKNAEKKELRKHVAVE